MVVFLVLVVLFLALVGNLKEKMCLWLFFLSWVSFSLFWLVIQKQNVSVVVLLVLVVLVGLFLVLVGNLKEKMCLWLSFLVLRVLVGNPKKKCVCGCPFPCPGW